jgi:hypothetical protein
MLERSRVGPASFVANAEMLFGRDGDHLNAYGLGIVFDLPCGP